MTHSTPMPDIHDSEFTRFEDFQPTRYDSRGLGAEDNNRHWLVVPLFYHPKTAEILETSNWEALVKTIEETAGLEPESDRHGPLVCFQRHYFGHWATDFECFIVRPGSAAHEAAEAFCAALADYPVADEEDFSEREYDAQLECIDTGMRSLTIEVAGEELDTDGMIDLVHRVREHMFSTCTGKLEQVGQDGGGGPDRAECEQALREMGYIEKEDGFSEWRKS